MRKTIGVLIIAGLIMYSIGISKVNRISEKFSLSITGTAGGNDSTIVDSFYLSDLNHWKNGVILSVYVDSQKFHNVAAGGDFGMVDSISVIVKSQFEDQWFTIDSLKKVMLGSATCTLATLNYMQAATDSVYAEKLWLIIRIADTVGVTTDSVAIFKGRYEVLHKYQD